MVKKGLLNQLIQTHDLKSLERHIVYSYLNNKGYNYSENAILKAYFKDFDINTQLYFDTYSFNISSVKELENYLELIIPVGDRKINGAYFTPNYIIDFIIEEIQPKETDTNLDPSCGCGAFLVGLTDYYRRKFHKSIKAIIKENIFGSDILDYNIRRAKLILTIYALQYSENIDEDDLNLFQQDSLRATWSQKFHNIVGNPPYVKLQDLSEENRKFLSKSWKTIKNGSFNLYFAFFELGYKLLSPGGRLGYITPNNYFTSLAGEPLRKFFIHQKCVTKIVDFNCRKVFDAQTYTAVTFLNKNSNNSIKYDRIKNNESPEVFLKNVNYSFNYLENLNIKKWRLLKTDEQNNIKIIESIGKPIGSLFDISVGIATLKDDVFFVNGSKEKNGYFLKFTEKGEFEIEKESVKSVYKISDFKTQEEIKQNTRKIIFPYKILKGSAIPIQEKEFKTKFPRCFEYLLSEKETLLKRDKGKTVFDPFYAFGRTQGLTKFGKKILNPTFSQHPRFLLIAEEESFFTNGYGLFFKDKNESGLFDEYIEPILKVENIEILQKILNSVVMDYYISKTSVAIEGGYPCYQKNFIEKFTIPSLTEQDIDFLKNTDSKNEIDDFLISKYQLKIPVPNRFSYTSSNVLTIP